MIFRISNTRYDRLPLNETYPALSKYGYHDDATEGWGHTGKVIINSIEELVSLSKDLGQELIIFTNHCDPSEIEIYDDWRE